MHSADLPEVFISAGIALGQIMHLGLSDSEFASRFSFFPAIEWSNASFCYR
jgi:hypothetical protein